MRPTDGRSLPGIEVSNPGIAQTVATGLDGDGHLPLSAGEESVDLAVPKRQRSE